MSNKIILKEIVHQMEAGADGTTIVWDSSKQFGFRMDQTIREGGTATGTDTYVLTPAVAQLAYITDQYFNVTFTNANTGAATLNVSGLGAKAIQYKGAALSAGRIPAGSNATLKYDGTQFQLVGYWG